jgi:hypothetical protein
MVDEVSLEQVFSRFFASASADHYSDIAAYSSIVTPWNDRDEAAHFQNPQS